MNVTIGLTGVGKLAHAWEQAPDMVVDELALFAEGLGLFAQGEIQERTPVAQGLLRESFIAQEPERVGTGVIAQVGTSLSYAVPVELGSRAHMPPVQPLMDWVKVKFGLTGPAGKAVAYAIARKIAKTGTKGAHMVSKALEAIQPEAQRQFEATVLAIRTKLGEGA